MSIASDASTSLEVAIEQIEEARKRLWDDHSSTEVLAHISAAEALVQEAKTGIIKKFLVENP